jgi:hypothetical protein
MPLLAELIPFLGNGCYKDFAPTELATSGAPKFESENPIGSIKPDTRSRFFNRLPR